jgi:GH24 family phage-related lysozyme (muramidase)
MVYFSSVNVKKERNQKTAVACACRSTVVRKIDSSAMQKKAQQQRTSPCTGAGAAWVFCIKFP